MINKYYKKTKKRSEKKHVIDIKNTKKDSEKRHVKNIKFFLKKKKANLKKLTYFFLVRERYQNLPEEKTETTRVYEKLLFGT